MEIPVLLHMLHFWKVRKGWTNVPVLRPVTDQGSSNKLKETKNFALGTLQTIGLCTLNIVGTNNVFTYFIYDENGRK